MSAHRYSGQPDNRVQVARERAERTMVLPSWSVRLLDADGTVRGRNWRQMPGYNPMSRAISWWLWKRGILNLDEERALATMERRPA